jgi:hypothetical protein
MRSFDVVMCLTLHFGGEPIDCFLDQLARDIRKGKLTKEMLEAYKLYAEVKGWKKSSLVRAYEIAKEMGYGPNRRSISTSANVRRKIEKESTTLKKDEEENGFDLSEFESQ